MKRCSGCGLWKVLEHFWARADTPDGKQHYCKGCATRAKQYHRATKPPTWKVNYKKRREKAA